MAFSLQPISILPAQFEAGSKSFGPLMLQKAISLQPGLASQAASLMGGASSSEGLPLQASTITALGASPDHTDAQIKKVSQNFEAIFMRMLLKEMRDSVQKSDVMGDSNAMEIFQSMQDDQLSQSISAAGGIGIGKMIYQRLKQATTPHLRTYS